MSLPAGRDVVIVGAGIAGLCLARELRRRGIEPLLLDRSPSPPSESTARSAWMIRTDADEPDVEALARRGGEIWRSGDLGSFQPTGGFLLGRGERDDVAERLPALSGRGEWRPQDGVVDASSALAALAVPRRLVAPGTEVVVVNARGDGLDVVTPRGILRARIVVNAAGAWAGSVGGLRLEALKRHVVLAACAAVPPGSPFAWDVREHVYLVPHEAGILACACDEIPSSPGDAAVEPGVAEATLLALRRAQPGLPLGRPLGAWAGQRTFAPDRRFVLGWDPRRRGLFHVAGLGGHGITVAPAIAEACAPLIEAGPEAAAPAALSGFSPSRPGLA